MKGIFLLIVLAVVVGLGIIYTQFGDIAQENGISSEEAAEIGLTYIKENLLYEGMQANIVSAVEEEYCLYKFEIDVEGQTYDSYITKDGKLLFPQGVVLENEEEEAEGEEENGEQEGSEGEEQELEEIGATIGNFSVYNQEVCLENNKPIVYFFGSETCPHCIWEHPVISETAERFGGEIVFHDNMGLGAESPDMGVFLQYNPNGSVPTMVLGCKYSRIGSGSSNGEELEKEYLTALMCDLTNGLPADVCADAEEITIN